MVGLKLLQGENRCRSLRILITKSAESFTGMQLGVAGWLIPYRQSICGNAGGNIPTTGTRHMWAHAQPHCTAVSSVGTPYCAFLFLDLPGWAVHLLARERNSVRCVFGQGRSESACRTVPFFILYYCRHTLDHISDGRRSRVHWRTG